MAKVPALLSLKRIPLTCYSLQVSMDNFGIIYDIMNNAEQRYTTIGESLADAQAGIMFGWQCYTYKRKPFLFFDKNSGQAMVFKLDPDSLIDAMSLSGADIFNPGDKGKPMKNWVVVPLQHHLLWEELALKAFENIMNELAYGK